MTSCAFFLSPSSPGFAFFFKSNPASTKIYKDFVRSTSGQLIVLTLFLFAVASMCASVFRCFLKTDDKNTLQAMSDDTYDSLSHDKSIPGISTHYRLLHPPESEYMH